MKPDTPKIFRTATFSSHSNLKLARHVSAVLCLSQRLCRSPRNNVRGLDILHQSCPTAKAKEELGPNRLVLRALPKHPRFPRVEESEYCFSTLGKLQIALAPAGLAFRILERAKMPQRHSCHY